MPVTAMQYHTGDDILTSCQAVTAEVLGWQPQLMHVLHSSSAVGVLMELSPGGALMQGRSSQQILRMYHISGVKLHIGGLGAGYIVNEDYT